MSATLLKRGLIASLTLAVIALAAGCGGSTDNPPIGPTVDPALADVQPQINTFLDSVFVAFSAGFSSYNEVPVTDGDINIFYGPGVTGVPTSTYEYTASGWHHITFNSNGTVTLRVVNDSLQFSLAGTVQELPAGADMLDYRHHWSVTAVDQTGNFNNSSGSAGITFFALTGPSAQLVGDYDFTAVDNTVSAGVTTNNTFGFVASFTNINVTKPAIGNWGTGCPASGTISFTINHSKIVTSASGSTTTTTAWTGTAVFTNGTATITLSTGAANFSYTRSVCAPTQ